MLKPRQRTIAAFAAGAAALAMTLSGCQSAVDLETEATSEPVEGGILTIAQASDAQPANLLAGRLGNQAWASNVFETLTYQDADGEPQPLLATEWALSGDGLSMDLTIRDDVTFHSGRAMTAEDVKFSFEQAAAPEWNSQVGYIAKSFEGIDVVSPTELTIRFSQPTQNIFDFLEYAFIIDSETYTGLADGSQVIGTGPFLFESWSPGTELTLVRNDEYWGDEAYLDGIEIAVISDSTAMLNAVRSDRSQIAVGMNPVDVQSMAANDAFTVENLVGSVYPLGLNVTQAPFDTKEARQGVNFAIDRERIAEQIFGDAGVVTNLFWSEDTPGYPEDLANAYAYDPEKARELLADAGAEGAEVTINVISLPQNTSVAEIVRNNLEEVGLKPTINAVETQSFGQRQIAGDLGQAFMPLHGLNGLGPVTLMDTLPSLREGNSSQFWTDEYVELRTALAEAEPGDEFEEALHALSEYIVDEAFTSVIAQSNGQVVVAETAHDLRWSSRAYLDAKSAFVTE
ncbi:ABC transporter substrate-binding protein [Agromyces indicus]|uniref:ABC transporter substrate-binding protein n=1 Tax=Agromyces indicus TaxID=758919 RepID=A0ABU1FFP6_9MICO|nr:ABC transporter substrate-binding protein [Agromyces indicus]MDR5690580.1 ABC transporter substrate-binding protein [Agromyces indicus]